MLAFSESREPRLACSRLIVSAGWLTVALCLLLYLAGSLEFQWHSESGVYGWIAANQYPKQKEFFFFMSSVAGIPALMAAGRLVWIISAAMLSGMFNRPARTILRQTAILHIFLLAPWPGLLRLETGAIHELKLPLFAAALPLMLLMTAWNLFRRRSARARGEREASRDRRASSREGANSAEGASSPRAVAGRRGPFLRMMRSAGAATVYLLAPAMIYMLGYSGRIDGRICFFHQSEFMVPLDVLLRGGIPFRDVYLQHGLFHNAWFPLLGAAIFGPTVAGVRSIMSYIYPLSFVAAYFMVLKTFRFGFLSALVASFIFLASGIGGRGTFGFLSIALLAGAIERPYAFRLLSPVSFVDEGGRKGWRSVLRRYIRDGLRLTAAGFLAMLAFWHSVEVGLYALAAGAVFTGSAGLFQGREVGLGRRPLPLMFYMLGGCIGFWTVGWYFLLHGALGDVFWNVWIQCVYQVETWGLAFPGFSRVFEPLLTAEERIGFASWVQGTGMRFYIGAAALTAASVVLTHRAMGRGFWNSGWAPQLFLLTLTGFFYFRTVLGRSDAGHTHYGVFFSTLLGLFAVAATAGRTWDIFISRDGRVFRRIFRGGSVLLLAIGLGAIAGWYVQIRWQPAAALARRLDELRVPVPLTAAGSEPMERAGAMNMGPGQTEAVQVIDYIRSHIGEDERVFDFSNQAMWLFFAGRRPASRYFLVAYASTPSMQREVIAGLEQHCVNLVIYSSGTWFDHVDGVPQAERHPLIAEYLNTHFEPADRVGTVQFRRRRHAVGP